MNNQHIQEENRLTINEFLSRSPVFKFEVTLNEQGTTPEEFVQINDQIIEDETDLAISDTLTASKTSGFTVSGDAPDDLKEGINAFYNTMCFDLLGQRMSEDSLMQPIRLISAFLEGIKSLGRIDDYDVRFDPNRSSHRLRAVGYSIAITAVNSSWWETTARKLWDSFVDLVLDPDAPTLALRVAEVLPKWIEALLQILQNPPIG